MVDLVSRACKLVHHLKSQHRRRCVCVFIHPVASLFEQGEPPGVMFVLSPLAS